MIITRYEDYLLEQLLNESMMNEKINMDKINDIVKKIGSGPAGICILANEWRPHRCQS